MTVLPPSVRDPRSLAESVRALATRAYDALREPPANNQERLALARQIADLQGRIDGLSSVELSLWLENLRRQVESTGAPLPVGTQPRRQPVATPHPTKP